MPLNILITGAGISGLSSALSLRRAGHTVTIFERSRLTNEIGAAINIPPNASRPLLAWGIDPVKERFVAGTGIAIGIGATGKVVDETPLGWVGRVFGGEVYFAHRVDLHEALRGLCVGEGRGERVRVELGRGVVGYVSLSILEIKEMKG